MNQNTKPAVNVDMLLALAPWVLFSSVAARLGANAVGFAAALACAGSLILAVRGMSRGGLKIIDTAGVLTFAVLAVAGFVANHTGRELLVHYGRGGCAALLALIMLISAFTVPFTEQYAREQVDSRYWGSPVFRATNRKISLVWSALIAMMAVSHLIAGVLVAHGHNGVGVRLILNWAVPLAVIYVGVRQTQRIAAANPRVPA